MSSEVDVEVKRCLLPRSRPLGSLWRMLLACPSRDDIHVPAAVVVFQKLLSKDESRYMCHVHD